MYNFQLQNAQFLQDLNTNQYSDDNYSNNNFDNDFDNNSDNNFSNEYNNDVNINTEINAEIITNTVINDIINNCISNDIDINNDNDSSSDIIEVIIDNDNIKNCMNIMSSTASKEIDIKVINYQKTNNEDIFNEIYHAYLPKFKYVAFKKHNEDIEQELSIALFNAINTFKESAGVKFNTYFWTCARNHLGVLNTRSWAKKRANNNYLISLQNTICSNDDGADIELITLIEDPRSEDIYHDTIFQTFLEKNVFPLLPETDQFIISKYIQGYTHEEISKMLNTTTQYVHMRFRRMSALKEIKSVLCKYYGLDINSLNTNVKPTRKRKLTIHEIAELIKSRLAYKPGDFLLTEQMIYARDKDNAKTTINS